MRQQGISYIDRAIQIYHSVNNDELIYLPDCDSFDWQPPKSTFRPFSYAEEFQPFRDKWVKDKSFPPCQAYRVSSVSNSLVWIGGTPFSYRRAFESFEFEDGTPFGIQVEQG